VWYLHLMIVCLLLQVTNTCYQSQYYYKNKNRFDCSEQQFNETDSSGVFTGTVTEWNQQSWERALEGYSLQAYLSVSDESGTIVRFMILTPACLHMTKNVQVNRLVPGTWVRVVYRMEEATENGVVNSRAYYAGSLDYLYGISQ